MDVPIFGWIEAEVVALAIPILVVLGGVAIAMTAISVNGRRKELEHRERIIAMEKGLTVPAAPPAPEVERPKFSNRRANGLVLTGVGLALTIAMWTQDGSEAGVWGLIPLFIGIGLLVAGAIDKREYDSQARNRDRHEIQ